MIALGFVVTLAASLAAFVGGVRLGVRWARRDEREWLALLDRIRSRSGKCPTCGNHRAPTPVGWEWE